MIMIRKIHTGYVNTSHISFIIWNCASAFIRMFFIQKIFPQHWRFLPDNSFTRLNLLYKTNLSQSMQWTDCPILTASVLLLYPPLGPSLDTSFCSPFLSFGKQPSSPFSWQSRESTLPCSLCLYVSQPPCTLSVVGSCFVF